MMDFNPDLLNEPGSSWNSQSKLSLMMPIYNRTILLRRKMAEVEVEVKKKGLKRTLQQVEYNIIEAYYNALLAREAVGVMEFAGKVAAEGVRVAKSLYKHEMALEVDVNRASEFAARMRKEYDIAVDNREMALANLCFTMGVDVNKSFTLSKPVKTAYYEDKSIDRLQKTALERRSDYLALNDKKSQLNLMKKTIQSEGQPSLSLGGEYNWDAERFAYDTQGSWTAGLRLDLNLFDGNERAYKAKKVDEQKKELAAGKDMMAQGIKMSVEKSYRDYHTARSSYRSAQAALTEAETNYKLAQSRYKNEFATYLQLQQAQLGFLQANLRVIQSEYDVQIKGAKLALAVGDKDLKLPEDSDNKLKANNAQEEKADGNK